MERSVHDALCVVKRVLEGKKFVAGGGCVEAALSIYLENFAISLVSIAYILAAVELVLIFVRMFLFRAHGNNWLSLSLPSHYL